MSTQDQAGARAAQNRRCALEDSARDDRTATEQVHVGARSQINHRMGLRSLNRSATAQGQALARVNVYSSRLASNVDAGGADHRTAGVNAQHSTVAQHTHAAAGRAKQAGGLGAHFDIGTIAGAGGHIQINAVLRDQPATEVHLLGDVEVQAGGTQTGIGRAQWGLEIECTNLQQATVGADGTGHLNVTGDHNFIGRQAQGIGEFGLEVKNADGRVFDVAHDHDGTVFGVTNTDFLETIGQGVEVTHAQSHEACGTGHRLVSTKQGLARATNAVSLAIGLGRDHQQVCTGHTVTARYKVDVIGGDVDPASASAQPT